LLLSEKSPVKPKLQLHLGAMPKGNIHSWRHPGGVTDSDMNIEAHLHAAQVAERGKFDFMFYADSVSFRHDRIGWEALKGSGGHHYFDAMTVLPALAAVTQHIGLAATISTTYNEPYHVARKLATLDHISHGRAAWNLITSGQDSEAWNFNLDEQLPTEVRYERAREFLTVVRDLWDSWEDDAILRDPETKMYFDPARVHTPDHRGNHFKVRGPLNLPRPPQGQPIICQAGGSVTGWELAAETSDLLFTKSASLSEAQSFYRDVKGRMAKYGRTPDQLKIMMEVSVITGRTTAEAEESVRAGRACQTEAEGRAVLRQFVPGIDFSHFPLDEPLPDTMELNQAAKRFRISLDKEGGRRTMRELMHSSLGGLTLIGSPGEISDAMHKWVAEKGCDGFVVHSPLFPQGLEDIVDLVIPELQNRGLFRADYAPGAMLRDHLGLARPENRHTRRPTGSL
jgi:FMN-dependent oxidoreductase (nitrilotriacetate monooxygenase family)